MCQCFTFVPTPRSFILYRCACYVYVHPVPQPPCTSEPTTRSMSSAEGCPILAYAHTICDTDEGGSSGTWRVHACAGRVGGRTCRRITESSMNKGQRKKKRSAPLCSEPHASSAQKHKNQNGGGRQHDITNVESETPAASAIDTILFLLPPFRGSVFLFSIFSLRAPFPLGQMYVTTRQ